MPPRIVKPEPDPWSYRETTDSVAADEAGFYKVEVWDRQGLHIETMLHASNSLDRAKKVYDDHAKKRPRAWITLRQGIRVLREREPGKPARD